MPDALDLVMPVFNEEASLPAVLESLRAQVTSRGRFLPRGAFRIIAVDNASTDHSREILEHFASDSSAPELVIVEEPEKGVVAARARGAAFALQYPQRRLIVHCDSDNLFPQTFVSDILGRFACYDVDVFSYLGFEPLSFWSRVPELAERQFAEIGSISFDRDTLAEFGFEESRALLSARIYRDFENVPTQCGLAMTKQAYWRAGGYRREFNADGSERLGEARNLMFRLDLMGARFDHQLWPCVEVNPRRYLLEAEDLWAGRSYNGGMTDLRAPIHESHYDELNDSANGLDYNTARRNAIQRYIVDPCIARPARLAKNSQYFECILNDVQNEIREFHRTRSVAYYTEVRPLSDRITDLCCEGVVDNLRRLNCALPGRR